MQVDLHAENPDGRPGKLLDVIDRQPENRKTGQFVEFDGEMHKVMTGIRNFIIVTQERWARVSGKAWRKV